nr:dehydrogenase/reductase SDR family protein 7-like [Onthophagus taurus]
MPSWDVRTSYWNIGSSLSLAVTIPFIIYKVMRAVYLHRSFRELRGKVVVITGASSGLGEALAHEFYKKGCLIVLCARRRQELDRVREDLLKIQSTGPTHHPIIMPLDLSDINSLETAVTKILEITGHIDILINNGGVSHRGNVIDTKPDVDIKIMVVNYFGAVALTKAILPNMIKQKQGHIVQISSIQGLIGLPSRSAYCASKHALQAFSDSLRAEVKDSNIHVTVVSPGYIKTHLSENALTGTGNTYGQMDETTLSGYTPEYVAECILTAVVKKTKEVVISPFLPKIAIFLRRFMPHLYFVAMSRRARKTN